MPRLSSRWPKGRGMFLIGLVALYVRKSKPIGPRVWGRMGHKRIIELLGEEGLVIQILVERLKAECVFSE